MAGPRRREHLFGTKRTFVPIGEATERDGTLAVPFEKAMVKDAPSMEADGRLTKKEEAELDRHYGRDRPWTPRLKENAGTA